MLVAAVAAERPSPEAEAGLMVAVAPAVMAEAMPTAAEATAGTATDAAAMVGTAGVAGALATIPGMDMGMDTVIPVTDTDTSILITTHTVHTATQATRLTPDTATVMVILTMVLPSEL